MSSVPPPDRVLHALQERAKELSCLYRVDDALADPPGPLEDVLRRVAEALPPGWLFPDVCEAQVSYRGRAFATGGFAETPWTLSSDVVVEGETVGRVTVAYRQAMAPADEGPFLKEERKLLDSVAERLGQALARREAPRGEERQDWRVVLDLVRRTDHMLLRRVTRRMLNQLAASGVAEARDLMTAAAEGGAGEMDENRPLRRWRPEDVEALSTAVFEAAGAHLPEAEVLAALQTWIKEDRLSFLVQALESSSTSLVDIANVLERYRHTGVDARELSPATQSGLKAALVRRLLTEDTAFVAACRRHVELEDFLDLMRRIVLLPDSHGRLGGKSSGLFLATQVLRRSDHAAALRGVRIPRTFYLPSDGVIQFVAYNDLDEVYDWKYRPVEQLRQEYPHLLQVFKSSRFPPDIVSGLGRILDEVADVPLIVRSSSLLEDRFGSAFSGKYRSVFLANQGTKAGRLDALLDAVSEVYASVFAPDAVQYRAERGLLEHHEEMAVMIQEVVGLRAGRYFLPAWSGVALSNNELRWSPRIRREDGLLRLVPGLGTRAVDRLADDYPVLIAPGQPGLRVNLTAEEVVRYSPQKADVINLESRAFETVAVADLVAEAGEALPGLAQLVSVVDGDRMRQPVGTAGLDARAVVFTFEGLTRNTAFIEQMKSLLAVLREALGTPVDLEFASDGRDLYLVQCRAQGYTQDAVPDPIPRDLPSDQVLFSARRYVSNGRVGEITHVVYVDPDAYAALPGAERMREVGRAVGRLNALLPKRQFILMGPGRWGSRGDIRLGVSVGYSDISNAAVLVEIARKRGHYVPDLSFGTHFFQDLVESSIRYLPLYPDDPGVAFNEPFFRRSPNLLPGLLPEFAHLEDALRVIDVPAAAEGRVLRILMNADLDEAVGALAPRGAAAPVPSPAAPAVRAATDDHWRWRLGMARQVAADLDPARFGVKALYLFGSTKNATAGPASDIDLIVHFDGTPEQERELRTWLEGWSLCLAEMNFLRTGYRRRGLLDVQLVTDADLAGGTSYAAKIGAVTDAARPLDLRGRGA